MKQMNRTFLQILLLTMIFVLFPFASAELMAQTQRMADSETQSVVFANDDFTFVVKDANGGFVVAGTDNVPNPKLLQGATTSYSMLGNNPEFKKMIEFYKKSYNKRFEVEKNFHRRILAEAEAGVKPGKTPSRSVKATIEYEKAAIQAIENRKVPPLVIVVGQNPNETTSCMQPWPLEYVDRAGNSVKVPASILLQQATLEGIASDDNKLWHLITLAHETGHMISDNTTGMNNVKTDYKDPNPHFIVDDMLKNDSKVVELMSKGDPMGGSHWFRKITNSQTAFEEGFAEFTGSFFSAPTHDAYGIADDDFQTTKTAYKVVKETDEVKAVLQFWTDILKTPDELQKTEFFVAKILHRVAMSYADPYEGFEAIVKVKSQPDFIKNPNFDTFMNIYARDNSEAYAKFVTDFNKEIDGLIAKQNKNNNNRINPISELLSNMRNFVFAAGNSGILEKERMGQIHLPSTTAAIELTAKSQLQSAKAPKKSLKSGQTLKINEVNRKLKNSKLTQ